MDKEIAAAREAPFKKPVELKPRQTEDEKRRRIAELLKVEPCKVLAASLKIISGPTLEYVRKCYKFFRYDPVQAAQTIDTVTRLLELYAFLDYNNGRGPLKIDPKKVYSNKREELEAQKDDQEVDVSMGYNLKAAIRRVAQATYETDFDFQEALAKAFIPAKDGHLWYKPCCYRQFRFLQPVYLVGRLRGTKMEVVLGGIENDAKKPEQRFLGSIVTHIDGEDAVEHLVKYARDEYGKCRSAPTRLARVMTTVTFDPSDGFFRYERGYFARRDNIPENDEVEYTFYDQKTGISTNVSVKWRVEVYKTHKFINNQEYWDEACQGDKTLQENASDTSPPEVNKGEPLRDIMVDKNQGFQNSAGEAETKGEEIQNKVYPVARGPGIGFFIITEDDNNQFGVISVPTFEIEKEKISDWVNIVIFGLNLFKKKGIDRILIDFSNNGGGNACVANAFARIMSSVDSKYPFPYPDKLLDSRVRVSSILDILRAASVKAEQSNIFTPGYFNCIAADGTLSKCPEKANWGDLKAAENEELRLRASPDIFDRCPDAELAILEPLRSFKMWTPNVYLLTNGYCGSACATALAMLRYQEHLVVHFHHKAPCLDMENQECYSKAPFSFAGGQAIRSVEIFKRAKELGLLGNEDFPKPFVTSAEFSIAYRALIDRQYPLDLMHWDRNYIAIEPSYNEVMRIELRWKQAMRAVKEYKTKLGPLLELRQEIRKLEADVDKLDADYQNTHQLYKKKFAECEKARTPACVEEVDKYVTTLEVDMQPKIDKLKDVYDAKVKVLEVENKKANKDFGGKW